MPSTLRRAVTIVSVCLCGVLAARLATAQPGGAKALPTPAPSSIALVDLAKLTKSLDESKALSDRLGQQTEEFKKKLQEVKDSLASVNKDLEAMPKEQKGTPAYLKTLAQKYELEATLKARVESSQQLIDIAEGDNMRIMFNKVVDAVTRLGKERGFDAILWDDRSIGPHPTAPATGAQVWNLIRDRRIMYASDRTDITNEVLLMMNNEFKGGKK